MISSAVSSSPILQLAGTVNTGTAGTLNSVADVWSIQNVIGQLVPNPTSTLTFTHSGSTGPKVISIPSGTSIEVVSSGVALTLGPGNFASLSNGQAAGQLAIVTAGAEIPSGAVYAISSTTSVSGLIDTGISRLGAASLAIGNGTASDKSGTLALSRIDSYSADMQGSVSSAPTGIVATNVVVAVGAATATFTVSSTEGFTVGDTVTLSAGGWAGGSGLASTTATVTSVQTRLRWSLHTFLAARGLRERIPLKQARLLRLAELLFLSSTLLLIRARRLS